MLNCIGLEAEMRRDYLQGSIETIYFGGGTPSIIPPPYLQELMDKMQSLYPLEKDAEITLEANPDDISKENAAAWKCAGINRLSIGIQSFQQQDLEWMNRAHNAAQAAQAIETAQQSGFENITIDLIYGTPFLSDEQWQKNLERVTACNIPHLSAYALTVEPKTALHKMIEKKKVPAVDLEKQTRQFDLLMQWAAENNFEHYEISNFCRPGYRSRHNSSYWQGKHYLGLGPSAHSFNGHSRQWNVANNALYLQSLTNGMLNFEEETLSFENRLNEMIMISLRTTEGISLEKTEKYFGTAQCDRILAAAEKWIATQHLQCREGHLILTAPGRHFADGIAADLFL